jgi:photosystem II stability/assembly factor-like uncharacterized protein
MQNHIFSTLGMAMMIILVACNPPAPAAAIDTETPTKAQVNSSLTSTPEPAIAQSSILPTLSTNQLTLISTSISLTGTYFPSLTPRMASPTTTYVPAVPLVLTPTPILPLKAGQPITITDLHMFGDTRGWAIESTGHIVHTTNVGHTWQDVTPPQALPYNAGGFFALDADSAWATPACLQFCQDTDFMTIWQTGDGGQTWKASPPLCLKGKCGYSADISAQFYYPRTLQFIDAKTGWLLVVVDQLMFQNRYRIFKTSDGGASWNFIIDNMKGPFVFIASGIAFTDERTGWFGVSQVGGAEEPHPNWYVYKTIDGGHTWDDVDLPEPAHLPDAFALNPYWCGAGKVGITPAKTIDLEFYCDVYEKNTHMRYFFHFHNDGENWQVWQESGLGSVSFIDAAYGWRLTARNDGLYDLEQTVNGGLHWGWVKTVRWSGSLDFIDTQVGWAIATNDDVSMLVCTLDGGKTWAEIKPVTAKQ